jgi:hypothetical protein
MSGKKLFLSRRDKRSYPAIQVLFKHTRNAGNQLRRSLLSTFEQDRGKTSHRTSSNLFEQTKKRQRRPHELEETRFEQKGEKRISHNSSS